MLAVLTKISKSYVYESYFVCESNYYLRSLFRISYCFARGLISELFSISSNKSTIIIELETIAQLVE